MGGFSDRQRLEFLARLIISIIILIAGLVIIFMGDFPDATVKWAYGIVGLVVGYWLR